MTKSELIEEITEKTGCFTKRDIEIIVSTVFDSISESLARGEKIEIRGFGSFKVKQRGSRRGRNPKSGEQISVEPKKVPFFKTGKELRERVNSLK